jgi:DNA-binding transcriptional LysR family regulator
MELRQLEAFVEAAQRGSISRAARTLYLTQPSLTQRVRALEQELGQQLLVRSRQGVRLTLAGKLFLPRAEAALAALRSGAEEVKELREVTGGRLALAVTPDIALYVLPVPLARFRQQHPAVTISLETGRSFPMAGMVMTGRAELALVNRSLRLPDLHESSMYEERLLPVAAPDHALARRAAVTLEEFACAGLVAYRSDSLLRDLTVQFFDSVALSPSLVVRAHNTEAARRMVVCGLGVGLLPELSVRDDLAVGRLVQLPLEKVKLPTRGIWGLRRDDTHTTATARAFVDTLFAEGLPRGARTRRSTAPDSVRPASRALGARGA